MADIATSSPRRFDGLSSSLERNGAAEVTVEALRDIEAIQEEIKGVEERSCWPESYEPREVRGNPMLLGRRVPKALLRSFVSGDPGSPLRHLSVSSTVRELKELLSLQDVRCHLYVDLAMKIMDLPSAAAAERTIDADVPVVAQLQGAVGDKDCEEEKAAGLEGRPLLGGRTLLGELTKQVILLSGEARQSSAQAREPDRAVAREAGQPPPDEGFPRGLEAALDDQPLDLAALVDVGGRAGRGGDSAVDQECGDSLTPMGDGHRNPSFTSDTLPPSIVSAVREGHPAWSLVGPRVLVRSHPRADATTLAFLYRGVIVHGVPEVVEEVPWLRIGADGICGVRESLEDDGVNENAWIRIDGASLGLGGHLLEPAPFTASASWPPSVDLEDESRWKVVHSVVYMRTEPSTASTALAQVTKGCLVRGAERNFNGATWLRVRADALQHDDLPEMMGGVAWMLVHGSTVGLGELLRKVPVGPPPQAAELAAAGGSASSSRKGAPASGEAKEETDWVVVRDRAGYRARPSLQAEVLGDMPKGSVVKGMVSGVDGVKWLLVRSHCENGAALQGSTAGLAGIWLLVHDHFGPFLTPLGLQMSMALGEQAVGEPSVPPSGRPVAAAAPPSEEDRVPASGAAVPGASGLAPAEGQGQRGVDYEVRSVEGRGQALFAKRSFSAGECIFTEQPIFSRPKVEGLLKNKQLLESAKWCSAFKGISETLPAAGDHTEAKFYPSQFMVRAAIGYARTGAQVRNALRRLYHPDLQSSHPLVVVARRLAELCVRMLPDCVGLDVTDLHRAILVTEMNGFAGGHIYQDASRMNHSCAPNVVSVPDKQGRSFRALRRIGEGEELLHSYLGRELLLPTELRQHHLWRSKCFRCTCERCTSETDELRTIQCLRCAQAVPNDPAELQEGGLCGQAFTRKSLEALIMFLLSPNKRHVGTATVLSEICEDDEIREGIDIDDRLWVPVPPAPGLFRRSDCRPPEAPFAVFRGGTWRCECCGREPKDEELFLKAERLLSRRAECTFFSPKMTKALGNIRTTLGERIPLKLVQNSFLADAVDLATAVSALLGTRHWAAMWARLLFVDLMLSRLDYMGPAERQRSVLRCMVNWEVPAFMLLSLLKDLWDWLDSLNLSHDPSCFLFSRTREALSLLERAEISAGAESQKLFDELRVRVGASSARVEVLPMRPLIIQGAID